MITKISFPILNKNYAFIFIPTLGPAGFYNPDYTFLVCILSYNKGPGSIWILQSLP